MIHKIKWHSFLESFYDGECLYYGIFYGYSLCNENMIIYKNKTGSIKWRNVTCKNCLRQKKK